MDWTIIWVLLGVVGFIGLVIGIFWLLKKLGVPIDKIFHSIDIIVFFMNFADEIIDVMLKDDPELLENIDDIVDIIVDSLSFLSEQLKEDPTVDKDVMIESAKLFAQNIISDIGIELSEKELNIVFEVITMAYNAWAALEKTR